MLVAGSALSLIAPIAAQASDTINLEGLNNYGSSKSSVQRFDSKTFVNEVNEEIATLNGRVDGLEANLNNIEAGSFSDTTTMDGKAVFDLGALDYSTDDTSDESVRFAYSYTLNLNSSFTGDDNLYVRIKTGNHAGWMADKNDGGYLSSANGNGDTLKVDKIWYQFPVGDNHTVWVGPKIENYYMHAAAPSLYKPVTKQFTLGGNGNAYGASTDTGAGWAYVGDNGWSISSNIGTKSNSSCRGTVTPCGTTKSDSYVNSGLLTDETKTSWATQVGYTEDQWSASVILNQKYNGWTDGYFHSEAADNNLGNGNFTAIGLRGWWSPEDTGTAAPSVSLGYDTTSHDGVSGSAGDNSNSWFVGLMWEDIATADDKIGLAFGQPTTMDNESKDPFAYELYYSYQANDSVTITPTIFGGTDRDGGSDGEDVFGALVQTTFKFLSLIHI